MAKIIVEVDLLKPLPQSVFVGQEYEDSPLKGYTQKLEYEGVPKYCKHCRKIGHYMINCSVLEKKKTENLQEEEKRNQGVVDLQSIKEQEGSKAEKSSNEKSPNLPSPEISQKQHQEEICRNISKDKKKKTKKKKPKKLPKKKSKVVFKPSNRRDQITNPCLNLCGAHQHISYFRFLNCWVNIEGFFDIVKESWNTEVIGNPMWILQSKLKALSKKLSQWSRKEIGDINDAVTNWEDKIQELEDIDIEDNSEKSREDVNMAHAHYIRWLNRQESMLKQKSQVKWFEEGEKNTKYFHSILREKRRRQQVNRIKNSRGKWIKGDDKIANRAVRHFQNLFNITNPTINNSILDCIPFCVSGDDNSMLSKVPEEVEI
ncbi:hypothetical protein A4A49_28977 [Nicotiana attenuata]|uniref:DUF4283 domain-containing protein n=1 Tax=Nicotiana attenuata TaxID=49451 RepID=A0A314LBR6_NICAT|nr:hypothetical protein A4A49_28977 [Nicotiana attenuata]